MYINSPSRATWRPLHESVSSNVIGTSECRLKLQLQSATSNFAFMSRTQLNVSNDIDDQLDWIDEIKMQQDVVLLEGDMMSTDSPSTSSINIKSSHSGGSHVPSMDTLDEPISETLLRDLKGIASKTRHILLPTSSSGAYKSVLKDWDLWGPLLLCTFMGLTLHHNGDGRVGPHFAEIFVLIWLGSYVVGLNYKLLSLAPTRRKTSGKNALLASPSIFQLLCVLGYCLVPPCGGIILLKAIESVFTLQMHNLLYEKLFVGTLLGFIWPTVSAVRILSRYQDQEKRLLAIYPIALFYFIISWFIISAH